MDEQTLLSDDAKTNGNNSYSQSSNDFEKSRDEEMEAKTRELQTKTKKLILPVYGAVGIGALILTIIGMVEVWEDVENILIIIAGTIFGAVLGAYGVYKWGTISMEIERLKGENNKYEGEIGLLKNSVDGLRGNVQGLQNTVGDLKRDTQELNDALREFDDLRKSLQDLSSENEVCKTCYCCFFVIT